jgi:hypothetical protein
MRCYITAVCLLMHTLLTGQESRPLQTLANQPGKIGWFLAPSLGATTMDGDGALLLNLRTGAVLGDQFSVGAYANTALTDIFPLSEPLDGVYMDYYSFGGFVEYTLKSSSLFHLSFPVYFGYGEVEMDNNFGPAGLGEANFFQLEPTALLELNLHRHARLQLGAGYRLISDMNYRNLNQSDLSGWSAYLGLRVGLFRFR